MKALIKTLGLIVEVTFSHATHDNGHDIIWYKTPQGASFTKDELEFITTEDDLDYWIRLEHIYAGMAMQSLIMKSTHNFGTSEQIAMWANEYATALVKELKEE